MKIRLVTTLLVAVMSVCCVNANAQSSLRQHILLDSNWHFQLTSSIAGNVKPSDPTFDDTSWRNVHLPHDFVVEGAFTPTADPSHGSLPTQSAWYRKKFTVPELDRGKSIWIDFDGVYRDSTVYLNGVKLGEWQSGYAPFHYDISNAVKFGAVNTLAVFVDPTAQEGWWYEGGGIYRHVWLNVTNPVHVAPFGTYVVAKLPEPVPGQAVPPATVTIQTTVASPAGTAQNARLISQFFAPNGKSVGSSTSDFTLSGPSQVVTQSVVVNHPELWSLDKTNLYSVKSTILIASKPVDSYSTTFGIRTIRFDADNGFFLNGVSVKLKGTCNHQDFAGVGIAVSDPLEYWRVKTLKAMGSNAWRTSHNPPTSSLLSACDKLGMLVMDENRHLGNTVEPKTAIGTKFDDPAELDAMILRDRNHPSVIIWSMCNEEQIEGTPDAAAIFKAMQDHVHLLDPTRPVSCAMDHGYDTMNGISGVEDIQGINYHPWDYTKFHQAHPTIPVYGSETASEVSTRGVYTRDSIPTAFGSFYGLPEKGWVTAYDVNQASWAQTTHDAWAPQADQPFVAGGFAWTGFDYKGEPTPFAWPDINSNFGIVDECGFPKDGYYYYKSWWTSAPTVHIFPHWNWPGKEGQTIPVWVYSNAASVELIVNGVSLGKKDNPANGHLEWSVPYVAGTVIAHGYSADGKLFASDKVETTGEPAALQLVADRTRLTADGEDVVPVEVDVVDNQGRIVPDASSNRITFTVTGPGFVAGVGNGNPSDHDPDKSNTRLVFNGKALVVIGAGEASGSITLKAESDGLKSATVIFKSSAGSTAE